MPHPFGLRAGSTPGVDVASYFVIFRSVPTPHPDLIRYTGSWEPDFGLVQLRAESENVTNDRYGRLSLGLYERLKKQLISVYGDYEEVEFLKEGALYSGDDDFCQSIIENERSHFAVWEASAKSRLDSGIRRIILSIEAADSSVSNVQLNYVFKDDDQTDKGTDSL
jgi:hypothetical protein